MVGNHCTKVYFFGKSWQFISLLFFQHKNNWKIKVCWIGKVDKKHNMKAKSPCFFILFYFEKGGIKDFKTVKGGMYQKRMGMYKKKVL